MRPSQHGKARRRAARSAGPLVRSTERRALARAVRVERQIQALARQLDRARQRTNDRLQALALTLSAEARARERERAAASRGAGSTPLAAEPR